MIVFGYPMEKARMACKLMLPHEDNSQNKFRIWKERHYSDEKAVLVRLRTRPTVVPRLVFELTTSRTP